jgi:hypothetical protein
LIDCSERFYFAHALKSSIGGFLPFSSPFSFSGFLRFVSRRVWVGCVCSFAFDSLLSLFGWGEGVGVGVGVGWRSCFLQDWCGCMRGTEFRGDCVRCYAGMKWDGKWE